MGYDKDYIDWDEFGIVQVRCMDCNEPVIVRTYVELPSIKDPSKTVPALAWRRMANHEEVEVRLSDGSVTGLPHCNKCAMTPIDTKKADILRIRAMKQEMELAGKQSHTIESHMALQESKRILVKTIEEGKETPDAGNLV